MRRDSYDPKAVSVLGLILIDAMAFYMAQQRSGELVVWLVLNALVLAPLIVAEAFKVSRR